VGKIRHIAYRAENVEAMADFFVKGLEMELVQKRGNGAIDLSDGLLNITILPMGIPRADGTMPKAGIEHIGFTVEDEEASRKLLESAGARPLNRVDMGPVNYELKFIGIEDIEIDLGHWHGAAPVDDKQPITTAAHS
jgi:catechol 2,3-dioxygenase-like lactoylglutathione lyase family enzyme